MLAEKFFLVLETIMSRPCPNGSSIVVSTSRHVPIKLPSKPIKLTAMANFRE
jgi:hypothetical protein